MENNIENNEQQIPNEQQISNEQQNMSNEFFQKYKKNIRRANRVTEIGEKVTGFGLVFVLCAMGLVLSTGPVVLAGLASMALDGMGRKHDSPILEFLINSSFASGVSGVIGMATGFLISGGISMIFKINANRYAKKYLERERENINKVYEKVREKYEQLNLDELYKEVEEVYKELNEICDSIDKRRRRREEIINVFKCKEHEVRELTELEVRGLTELEVICIKNLEGEGYNNLLEEESKQILEYEEQMAKTYEELSKLNNTLNNRLNSIKASYEEANKQRDEFRNMIIDSDKECMKKYKDLKQQSETYQNKIEKYEERYVDVKKEYDKISERYKEIKNVHEISSQDKVKNSSRTKGKERE